MCRFRVSLVYQRRHALVMTNSNTARRNEYQVESQSGNVTYVSATNTLDAISRAGCTPENTYRVWIGRIEGGKDKWTTVWR